MLQIDLNVAVRCLGMCLVAHTDQTADVLEPNRLGPANEQVVESIMIGPVVNYIYERRNDWCIPTDQCGRPRITPEKVSDGYVAYHQLRGQTPC